MAIINLRNRITQSIDEYEDNKRSARSLIYVENDHRFDCSSNEVLILTVGNSYYSNSQQIQIPKKELLSNLAKA